MKYRNVLLTIFSGVLILGLQTKAPAQIFFTDSFDYADGDLTTVSGGLWATHSGSGDIQVVNGNAVVVSPGGQDDNRLTGAVMGPNDVWYYAVRFTVNQFEELPINPDYFIHFKDSGTSNFRARLATVPPTDPNRDFSLQIWASSIGGGFADWNGDFDYGQELIAVVRWNNGDGPNGIPAEATLWVNPVDINSTNITDDELIANVDAIESLALRQDSGDGGTVGSIVTIPVVSVGTDFDAVLAEVTPATGACVPPADYTVFRGIQRSGDLDSFADADGNVATFNPGFTINNSEAPVWLVFDANAPNATEISVTSTAGTPGIGIRAECFNWTTGAYVEVGAQEDETFNSQTKHTFGPIDSACIDGSGNVRWRVGCAKRDLRSTSHG